MGTCTVAIKKRNPVMKPAKVVVADVTLSASYATGGDTVTLKSLELDSCSALIIASNEGGYNYQAVMGASETTDPKIKLFQGDNPNVAAAPGVEVAAASSQTGRTVRVLAIGNWPGI